MPVSRPVFVLGAPRSGTGMTAAYIGSSPGVMNLREFGAFHWAAFWPERLVLRDGPTELRGRFEHEAIRFAAHFAERATSEARAHSYIDSTPGNLLVAPRLVAELPQALFVLVLRSAEATVQSLGRSFRSGHLWAGGSIRKRAELWRTFYAYAPVLPANRTIALNYDRLRENPEWTLRQFDISMRAILPDFSPRLDALATSYNDGAPSRTLVVGGANGFEFRKPLKPGAERMSPTARRTVQDAVQDVERVLRIVYADALRDDGPPQLP